MYRVDPFDGGLVDWTLPILFVEFVLLACVFAYDWVEKQRLIRGLEDHRGAVGRSAWVIFAGLISVGFAGILAIIFVIRRSWNWTQPAAVMVSWLLAPIAISGLFYWCLEPRWYRPNRDTCASHSIWRCVNILRNLVGSNRFWCLVGCRPMVSTHVARTIWIWLG